MMSHFDVVKAAREIQNSIKAAPAPSIDTIADYETTSWRLINAAKMDANEVVRLAAETTRSTTWHKRRAAVLYHCRTVIRCMLPEQDVRQRMLKATPENAKLRSEWEEMIDELDFCVRLHNAMQNAKPIPKDNRTQRHSKKHDLRRLPADWRELLLNKMGHTYYMHYLVTACCGCRPSELRQPVELRIEGDQLVVTITGKKVTEDDPDQAAHGQPWRKLRWTLPTSGMVQLLADYVREDGGFRLVGLKDENALKNFSTAVRDTARRLWPRLETTVTPYCLRHMFSADLKASNMAREDVAAALGHATDRTCKFYGPAQQAGKSSVAPNQVEAARKVRKKFVHHPPEKPAPVAPISRP